MFNSTQIGVWAAAGITASVATDLDFPKVARTVAKPLALYFMPAAPAYTVLRNMDKAVSTGRKVAYYGGKAYKIGKYITSPIEAINTLGAKTLSKYGVNDCLKRYCNVKSCDAFYYERPEFQALDED